jgi:phosphatidylserine/phosphatidylglycerophosphate/cardiolipin synthase-like enzyme
VEEGRMLEKIKTTLPLLWLLSVLCFASCTNDGAGSASGSGAEPKCPVPWHVYFSPHGGCTDAVVRALERAQESVLVQAYSFTSAPIAKALLDAKKRGVKVDVILDRSQRREHYSSADFLAHADIPVRIDAAHAIAHNKVMVIDGATVVTGSFNFTKAAEEHNAENLLVLEDRSLAARYAENWRAHAEHSEPYTGR